MRALIAILLLLSAQVASAHDASAASGAQWTTDPWIMTPLAVSAVLYLRGSLALWRKAGFGHGIPVSKALAYWAGWLTLAGALLSPLHWLGERLFTFHMVEHEILMAIAAPLLVLAGPLAALMWGLPRSLRQGLAQMMREPPFRATWRFISAPAAATIIHGAVLWGWHTPLLFEATVTSVPIHRLQHLSFFASALLFWWAMLRQAVPGVAAWHTFITMLHMSILGALIALAPRVLYLTQTEHAFEWGLTPLQDQQLAGLVMWVPAGTIYAGAALTMAALWITSSSKRGGDAVR